MQIELNAPPNGLPAYRSDTALRKRRPEIIRGRGPRAVVRGLTNAIFISIGLWMAMYGLAVIVF